MLKCIPNRNLGKSSYSITDDVKGLNSELKRLNKFIEEAETIEYEDQELRSHLKEVNDVRKKIVDVQDDYKIAVDHPQIPIEGGVKKILRRLCCKSDKDPFSAIITEIADINDAIKKINKVAKSQGITERIRQLVEEDNQRKLRRYISQEVEKVYIEIIDDIEKVVQMLMEPSGDDFISILGEAGSGKTIIARKVYNTELVGKQFECFAWVDRNEEFEDQTVLQRYMVNQLQRGAAPGSNNLQSLLEHNRCLIVLDDVRALHELRFLVREVGRANKSMMSKVLITTRMTRVAEIGQFYSPRPWTQAESWDLLYKISKIDRPETDMDTKRTLEPIGIKIVDKCDKLPLNVASIGEILRSTPAILTEWEKVLDITDVYLRTGGGSLETSFANSYKSLPPRLKRCFPYLALFPKDEPIEATRLYHLWIAEGMLSEDDISSEETLMEVAQSNLKQLASCNMIEVARRNQATKDIEWCKLHQKKKDLLHEKAQKEEFFETVHIHATDQNAQTNSHILFNKEARRLVIPPGDQCPDLKEMQSVRVLLVFTDSEFTAIQTLLEFKYLKFLEFDGCSFPVKQLPKGIFDIITLRHLLLNPTHDIELPSEGKVFPYIQTLNLVASHAIYVPNILRKMTKLKHLYVGYSCRPLASDKLHLEGLNKLETLDIRNGCMVKLEDLPGLSNLQLLGINIDAEDIPNGLKYISEMTQPKWVRITTELPVDNISGDAPDRLKRVLEFDKVNELAIKGTFELPEYEPHFWKNVGRLLIEETLIEGDPMKLLNHLPNLKELRLEDDEFMTDEIECDADAFPELVSLTLKWCSHLKKWRVGTKAFPKLSSLTIIGCQDLEEIVPEDGLRDLQALTVMDIHHMPAGFEKYGIQKVTDIF